MRPATTEEEGRKEVKRGKEEREAFSSRNLCHQQQLASIRASISCLASRLFMSPYTLKENKETPRDVRAFRTGETGWLSIAFALFVNFPKQRVRSAGEINPPPNFKMVSNLDGVSFSPLSP